MIPLFTLLVSAALAQSQPSPAELPVMVEKVRQKALDYSRSLPNFICTQVTKRYSGKATSGSRQPSWKLYDTLTIQLSYFEEKENYRLTLVNGKPVTKSMEQLHGGKFKGDFGSVLRNVFDPRSMADFSWVKWDQVNGRRVAVLHFEIDLEHAVFGTTITRGGRRVHMNWAAEGQVAVDAETMEVLRVAVDSVGLAENSPVGAVHLVLSYSRQKVGDQEFLLPLQSENWSNSKSSGAQRGVTLFTDYRKFSAESGIRFDVP